MLSKKIKIILLVLLLANFVVLGLVVIKKISPGNAMYFLNVGQADGELIAAGAAKFLIDSGKDGGIVGNLDKIIPFANKRIDVVFLSHGQQDHMGGMFYLVKNYAIGMVIYNGDGTPLWENLKTELQSRGIPFMTVSSGDKITYGKNKFDILWPRESMEESDSNENSMVVKYSDENISSLFTADISSAVEAALPALDIAADILKVPHHGSKFSSSQSFIDSVAPKVAVVEVGSNSYGHPTKEALGRILSEGAKIFRTDLDGIIKMSYFDGKIQVSSLR